MKQEFKLEEFLCFTASVARSEEFRSKKDAAENGCKATCDKVFELLTPPPRDYPPELVTQWEREVEKHLPTERDSTDARGAIQWVRGFKEEIRKSRFFANIYNVVKEGKVDKQNAGLAASIMDAYWKAAETKAMRYARKKKGRI